jgi:hypothetical protein
MTHQCPGGCGRQVAGHLDACRADWFRLPAVLRAPILAFYRVDARKHREAMSAAAAWYRAQS